MARRAFLIEEGTNLQVTQGQSLGDKTQIVSGLRSGKKIFSKLPQASKLKTFLVKVMHSAKFTINGCYRL